MMRATLTATLVVLLWACGDDEQTLQDLGVDLSVDLVMRDRSPHDSPLAGDTFSPLAGLGTLTGQCGELDETEWSSSGPFIFRNTLDFGSESFDAAKLSQGGKTILAEGNLNEGSLHSEIFAFEVLHRCELAKLLKTEDHVDYKAANGKKTDLLLEIDARKIGVSVTRAYHHPPTNPYTEAEAASLLNDKLADLPLSKANATSQDAWARSVLHVMAYDSQYADVVESTWTKLVDATTKGDAILVLTVTDGNDDIIY